MNTYQPPLTLLVGDCREVLATLPDESVQCCVTSPPYWGLRDYGHANQLGSEATYQEFVENMRAVFSEVRRVLKSDGTLWLNLGDSYATGAGKACSPGGGKQGENWHGAKGYDGEHKKHTMPQTVDEKNPNAGIPTFQPNRMPQEGLKPKDLVGIPWRVAFALQSDGWYLRQDIVWAKPNPMPESVTDRCTKSHEYIFLLTKSAKYFYDHEAIKEPAVCGWNDSQFQVGKTAEHQLGRAQKVRPSASKGTFNGKTEAMAETGQNAFRAVTDTRNKRSVWTVPTKPYAEAHFATYPPDLIRPCILAGTRPGDAVLDPFGGSGTTGQVALEHGRRAILIELNPQYAEIAEGRTSVTLGLGI